MAITLKIGDPVGEKNPTDVFELEVEYMSGDADAYETETFKFKSLDDKEDGLFTLSNALAILRAYEEASTTKWNDLCGIDPSDLPDILGIDAKIINEANSAGFFPGDVTCDHQVMAMFDGYELFYFDINGIKHDVTIEEEK